MSASVKPPSYERPPFSISVKDPTAQLRELHLSFTPDFQRMNVELRLEVMRAYIASMLVQAKSTNDEAAQRGLMMVIELSEQLLPYIQSDSMPLQDTLVVEMGEAADGSSLDELLS